MINEQDQVFPAFNIDRRSAYLVVGQRRILWFSANEYDSDYEGEPSWSVQHSSIVDYGRDTPERLIHEQVDVVTLRNLAANTLMSPMTAYRCCLVEAKQTVVSDAELTGLFSVRLNCSSYEHSPTADIRGYDLFVARPSGYVILLVQRADGRPDVEVVVRPQDVPEGHSMMDLVDASMESVGLEIPANPLCFDLTIY